MEAAGVVESVGPQVDHLRPGHRVLVLAAHGCYAEKMVASARHVAVLPDFLASSVAAALPIHYCTAHLVLTDIAPVDPGEVVLVLDAGCGAGPAAVQLASTLGGRVVAAVDTGEQARRVRELGAETAVVGPDFVPAVLEYTRGRGVDLVLDGVGGDTGSRALDALATFGRLVFFGSSSGQEPRYPPYRLLLGSQSLHGFNLVSYIQERPEKAASSMSEVLNWASSGRVTPPIGGEYPLAQAQDAHAHLSTRHNLGKLVLRPELDRIPEKAGVE